MSNTIFLNRYRIFDFFVEIFININAKILTNQSKRYTKFLVLNNNQFVVFDNKFFIEIL